MPENVESAVIAAAGLLPLAYGQPVRPFRRNSSSWFADSVIQRVHEGERVCAFPLTTGTCYTVGDPASYARAVLAAQDVGLSSRHQPHVRA